MQEKLSDVQFLPQYVEESEEIVVVDDKIEILPESISNPNVEIVEQTATTVKFKTTSNQEEEFTFVVQAENQGFMEEQIFNGKIDGGCNSTNITFNASFYFAPDFVSFDNVQGGASPYLYSVDGINFISSSSIGTTLIQDTYITLTVKDANECEDEKTVLIPVGCGAPPSLALINSECVQDDGNYYVEYTITDLDGPGGGVYEVFYQTGSPNWYPTNGWTTHSSVTDPITNSKTIILKSGLGGKFCDGDISAQQIWPHKIHVIDPCDNVSNEIFFDMILYL